MLQSSEFTKHTSRSMDVEKSSSAPQEAAASDRREDPHDDDCGYARPNGRALDSLVRYLNKNVMQQMCSEAQCDDQDGNSAQNIQDSHTFCSPLQAFPMLQQQIADR